MRYYLELQIRKFTPPDDLEHLYREPIKKLLTGVGSANLAIPEYQYENSAAEDLLKIDINGRILFFKFIKISIVLYDFEKGIKLIRTFVEKQNLLKASRLKFSNYKYNLLNEEFL